MVAIDRAAFDLVEQIAAHTDGGADYAFEAITDRARREPMTRLWRGCIFPTGGRWTSWSASRYRSAVDGAFEDLRGANGLRTILTPNA
jgi:hypothetical protein